MATLAGIENNTWGISKIGYGVIAEGITLIRQRIDIVLRTTKGSDPLRPFFGSNIFSFIDYPLKVAIPNIKAEIVTALQLWMPEIKVVSVTHTLASSSNPVFEITYQVVDEDLIDKLIFDLNQGTTAGTATGEIILQAFFPPNSTGYRYTIKLIRNNLALTPIPDSSGFASIPEMFDWAKANWFFWGRWFLLSDRIVCYMSSEGVNNATLSISVLPIVRIEAVFPPLEPSQFFNVNFTVNGQQAIPLFPEIFTNPGEVLFWIQSNWANYGSWYIEGVQADSNSAFTDEFSLEFDTPMPDTFKLILVSNVDGFTGEIQITTSNG